MPDIKYIKNHPESDQIDMVCIIGSNCKDDYSIVYEQAKASLLNVCIIGAGSSVSEEVLRQTIANCKFSPYAMAVVSAHGGVSKTNSSHIIGIGADKQLSSSTLVRWLYRSGCKTVALHSCFGGKLIQDLKKQDNPDDLIVYGVSPIDNSVASLGFEYVLPRHIERVTRCKGNPEAYNHLNEHLALLVKHGESFGIYANELAYHYHRQVFHIMYEAQNYRHDNIARLKKHLDMQYTLAMMAAAKRLGCRDVGNISLTDAEIENYLVMQLLSNASLHHDVDDHEALFGFFNDETVDVFHGDFADKRIRQNRWAIYTVLRNSFALGHEDVFARTIQMYKDKLVAQFRDSSPAMLEEFYSYVFLPEGIDRTGGKHAALVHAKCLLLFQNIISEAFLGHGAEWKTHFESCLPKEYSMVQIYRKMQDWGTQDNFPAQVSEFIAHIGDVLNADGPVEVKAIEGIGCSYPEGFPSLDYHDGVMNVSNETVTRCCGIIKALLTIEMQERKRFSKEAAAKVSGPSSVMKLSYYVQSLLCKAFANGANISFKQLVVEQYTKLYQQDPKQAALWRRTLTNKMFTNAVLTYATASQIIHLVRDQKLDLTTTSDLYVKLANNYSGALNSDILALLEEHSEKLKHQVVSKKGGAEKTLIQHLLDKPDEDKLFVLMDYIVANHPEMFEELFGVYLDHQEYKEIFLSILAKQNRYGETILGQMAEKNLLEQITAVAALGNVDIVDACGNTPLHKAVKNNLVQMVQLLASYGADVNLSSAEGDYPIHLAVERPNPSKMVSCLLSLGADYKTVNRNGIPVSMLAYSYNNELDQALAFALMDHVDQVNKDGNSLLHYACLMGDAAMVEALVKKGKANVSLANNLGQTPLMLACHAYPEVEEDNDIANNRAQVIKILFEHGAISTINTQDYHGKTALYYACENNIASAIGPLVVEGQANETLGVNVEGVTYCPFHAMVANNSTEVADEYFKLSSRERAFTVSGAQLDNFQPIALSGDQVIQELKKIQESRGIPDVLQQVMERSDSIKAAGSEHNTRAESFVQEHRMSQEFRRSLIRTKSGRFEKYRLSGKFTQAGQPEEAPLACAAQAHVQPPKEDEFEQEYHKRVGTVRGFRHDTAEIARDPGGFFSSEKNFVGRRGAIRRRDQSAAKVIPGSFLKEVKQPLGQQLCLCSKC